MAALSKPQLLQKITSAIATSGWNVLYISDEHPFRLNIYRENERYLTKIYIWNLTHGGGIKRPTDEYRIQVKVHEEFLDEPGWTTLLLGWWDEIGVFAGFDFRKHLGLPGWSSSIQIKEEALRNSYINGFATSDKGNEEIAIAFKPEFFVEYLKNLHALHDFGQSEHDLNILEQVAREPQINDEDIPIENPERRVVAATVTRRLRASNFQTRILTAYNNQCAICGTQLRLVDAAHIIPVQDNGSDETSNGIALCALHHRAYDRSLVTIWSDYSVKINNQQRNMLIRDNLDGGLERFEESLRPIILLPPAINDRPHIEYIRRANHIRGWSE